jgi:hypothetical protein
MPTPRPSFKAPRRSKTKDVFMLVGIILPKLLILNLPGSPFHEKRQLVLLSDYRAAVSWLVVRHTADFEGLHAHAD